MHHYTPITRSAFSSKTWRRPVSFDFVKQLNLIPIVAAELSEIVTVLPVAFIKANDGFQLVAVTSILPGMNLFVGPSGQWVGRYLPAALRGYPFKVLKDPTSTADLLCIDEDSGLISRDASDLPFFEEDGQLSASLKEILDLITSIEQSRVLTHRAIDALSQAGVIEPWIMDIVVDEKVIRAEGLYRINEIALLDTVTDQNFLSLRRAGALPIAYAQLISMSQISNLKRAEALQRTWSQQTVTKENTSYDPHSLFGPDAPEKLQFNW